MKKLLNVCAVLGLSALLAASVCAETIAFNTRTDAEADYIYEEMGSNDPGDGKSRFHDGWNYIIYEFPCPEGSLYASLTWKMQAQYKVSVTNADPDDWDNYDVIDMNEPTEDEVASGKADWGYANGVQYPTYDLSEYCKNNETGKIWVMMADAQEDNGWGGYIFGDFPVTYYVGTEPQGEVEKPKTLAELRADAMLKIEEGTQGFVVGTDGEKAYIYDESGANFNGDGNKYMDGNGYVIYEFKVNPGDTYAGIEWVLNNQFDVQVNTTDPADESAWTVAYQAERNDEENESGSVSWGNREFSLTPDIERGEDGYKAVHYLYRHDLSQYIAGNTSGKIWVRMGDVTTDNGWGGMICVEYPVTFKSGTSPITWKASGCPVVGTDVLETTDSVTTPPAEEVTVEEPELVEAPAEPAVEAPETVETPAAATGETAAQTFDAGIIAAAAAVVSLAGYAVSKKH